VDKVTRARAQSKESKEDWTQSSETQNVWHKPRKEAANDPSEQWMENQQLSRSQRASLQVLGLGSRVSGEVTPREAAEADQVGAGLKVPLPLCSGTPIPKTVSRATEAPAILMRLGLEGTQKLKKKMKWTGKWCS
jgi:hypothetical protein